MLNGDFLGVAADLVVALLALVAGVLFWMKMSNDQKRQYIIDLVHSAQQQFLNEKTGKERMDFVLDEVAKVWPGFNKAVARNIAEAAVKRMKLAEQGGFVELTGELDHVELISEN